MPVVMREMKQDYRRLVRDCHLKKYLPILWRVFFCFGGTRNYCSLLEVVESTLWTRVAHLHAFTSVLYVVHVVFLDVFNVDLSVIIDDLYAFHVAAIAAFTADFVVASRAARSEVSLVVNVVTTQLWYVVNAAITAFSLLVRATFTQLTTAPESCCPEAVFPVVLAA